MITDDKIREVKKLLRSGIPEGELKKELLSQGYTNEEIAKIFVPHKYDMRSWYFTFGIIFFIAGIYTALKNGSFLLFIFAAAMFFQYYLTNKKERDKMK